MVSDLQLWGAWLDGGRSGQTLRDGDVSRGNTLLAAPCHSRCNGSFREHAWRVARALREGLGEIGGGGGSHEDVVIRADQTDRELSSAGAATHRHSRAEISISRRPDGPRAVTCGSGAFCRATVQPNRRGLRRRLSAQKEPTQSAPNRPLLRAKGQPIQSARGKRCHGVEGHFFGLLREERSYSPTGNLFDQHQGTSH